MLKTAATLAFVIAALPAAAQSVSQCISSGATLRIRSDSIIFPLLSLPSTAGFSRVFPAEVR